MQKIKLVTIVGTDRSGSTLLDMMIGANHSIFSLGEIHRFWYYYRDNHLCTCGQKFFECPFWQNILNTLEKTSFESEQITILGWKRQLAILCELLFYSKNKIRHKYQNYVNAYRILYQSVLEQTNTEFLVDSCKDIIRAYLLHLSGHFEIYPVYLSRSVSDYAVSVQKPQMILNPNRHTGFLKAICRWTFRNTLTRLIIAKIRSDFSQLTYHRLANSPIDVISAISRKTGIPIQYDPQLIAQSEYHFLGGNFMKFKKFTGVRPDIKQPDTTLNARLLKSITSGLNHLFLKSNI